MSQGIGIVCLSPSQSEKGATDDPEQTRLAYSRAWHVVDLGADEALPLGRIATRIALTLMGKHKPMYSPSTDCGDYVVALGCHDLRVTGKKLTQKKYYSHTTRPGSLKEISLEKMAAKWGGAEILRRAVRGMLPKNRLRDKRMMRLKGSSLLLRHCRQAFSNDMTAFEGVAHPYKQNLLQFGTAEAIETMVNVAKATQSSTAQESAKA